MLLKWHISFFFMAKSTCSYSVLSVALSQSLLTGHISGTQTPTTSLVSSPNSHSTSSSPHSPSCLGHSLRVNFDPSRLYFKIECESDHISSPHPCHPSQSHELPGSLQSWSLHFHHYSLWDVLYTAPRVIFLPLNPAHGFPSHSG